MNSFEVRFSRPDEWLRELARDAQDDAVTDRIVRLAVTWSPAEICDLHPERPYDHRPLAIHMRTRWVQASYIARGQIVNLSGSCGLTGEPALDLAAEERERDLVSILLRGIQETGVDIRTGGLHGEDPNWHAKFEDEITAVIAAHNCATCSRPIYFANEIWRHKYADEEPYIGALGDELFGHLITPAGRDECYIETDCQTCNGSRWVEDPRRRGEDKNVRCPTCTSTPGKARRLHHLADPETRDRKV